MNDSERPLARGRGSQLNPPIRFGGPHHELDCEQLEPGDDYIESLSKLPTDYIPDRSRSIVSENNSPDVGFRFSINPYRGCAHGCAYCYARPTHEYLGYNAGLDFETKILVKEAAPSLFREFLARSTWRPEPIALSGVTDCYQPAERRFRLTRGCLEVALEARQPIMIISKNALVLRDLDLLRPLAAANLVRVYLSITTLDAELVRAMEPRTSTPAARSRAVRELAAAGVPVGVMLAPVIPGLNEHEIPAILAAASEAGAKSAGYILLRLPLTVAPVFREWLGRARPGQADRIEGRIRDTHDGRLNNSEFGRRMRGSGPIAQQINALFHVFAKRYDLDRRLPPLDCNRFRPPVLPAGQMRLF